MQEIKEQTINLIKRLQEEKEAKFKAGIYHRTQIDLTYNSNHIEGSKLTEEETRSIFETHNIFVDREKVIDIDDIIETKNHFKCFDYLLDNVFCLCRIIHC